MSYQIRLKLERAAQQKHIDLVQADLLSRDDLMAGGRYHCDCPSCGKGPIIVRVSSHTYPMASFRGETPSERMDWFGECVRCWFRPSDVLPAVFPLPGVVPPAPELPKPKANSREAIVVAKFWAQFKAGDKYADQDGVPVYRRRLSVKQVRWLAEEFLAHNHEGADMRGSVVLPGSTAEWALTFDQAGDGWLWVKGSGLKFQ